MQLDSAREAIQTLARVFRFPVPLAGGAAAIGAGVAAGPAGGPIVGLGVSVRGPKDYGVAIRLRSRDPAGHQLVRAAVAGSLAGEVDVQYAGRVEARPAAAGCGKRPAAAPAEPLRIGESVGHVRLPGAGT